MNTKNTDTQEKTFSRFHPDNQVPRQKDFIWVFGSNRAGRHGAGAAKIAHHNFSARYGVGEGLTGDAYAIPTKGAKLEVLSLDDIKQSVDQFIEFAQSHPKYHFYVTRVGCGLAGYTDEQVAPMFSKVPPNCCFPEPWKTILMPFILGKPYQELAKS